MNSAASSVVKGSAPRTPATTTSPATARPIDFGKPATRARRPAARGKARVFTAPKESARRGASTLGESPSAETAKKGGHGGPPSMNESRNLEGRPPRRPFFGLENPN